MVEWMTACQAQSLGFDPQHQKPLQIIKIKWNKIIIESNYSLRVLSCQQLTHLPFKNGKWGRKECSELETRVWIQTCTSELGEWCPPAAIAPVGIAGFQSSWKEKSQAQAQGKGLSQRNRWGWQTKTSNSLFLSQMYTLAHIYVHAFTKTHVHRKIMPVPDPHKIDEQRNGEGRFIHNVFAFYPLTQNAYYQLQSEPILY